MTKELKMVLITLMLITIGIIALWWSQRNCYQIEYQDLNGSHWLNVCEDGK